ncbi:S8 family serine peptidase [Jidongwangia harbinensis]|uniref:S8 family serine peptidase n=1 Tax=Jidongwangia harbinensis TaxID=2878561 RepID=UPI001CD9E6D9|nr:S8 family serine peptidase [Jidongwangia harbinensis]MCA2214133.1 S8 family serine peptidase [Jidongwangia harbinensis]
MQPSRTTPARVLVAAVAAAAAATALVAPASAAPDGDLAPLRPVAGKTIDGSYIVVYQNKVSGTARKALETRLGDSGVTLRQRYTGGLNGFAAELSAAELEQTRRDPNVAFVEPDSLMSVDTGAAPSWGLDRINQRNRPLDGHYWANANGEGVHAYVVDSGIRASHSEFGGRATLDANVVGDGRSDDCLGHGTHVAGTVGGATVGVAPRVRIHAVRVFGYVNNACSRTIATSTVIAGVNWVTNNAQRPAVMNLSLGGDATDAMDRAVQGTLNAGVSVAVAAGNESRDACLNSPARVAGVLTVGNTSSTDARWSTSNFGSCLDLFAPGTDIVSAGVGSDTALATGTGTSMASPHVAGMAALYLQRHRAATPAQVSAFIVNRTTPNLVTSGGAGSPNRLLYSTFDSKGDFNGDGVSDTAVWRPSDGTWYVRNIATVQWGLSGDKPVPGDYNGDGVTDYAVWRPSDGTWYVNGIATVQWGVAGDIPVAGDYDRNGTTDYAVYRPSEGNWYVRNMWTVQWGAAGDIPVPGDYSGDGMADVAVFRPSDGNWHVRGLWSVQWGTAGDVPMAGDYNGDGMTDVTVWRPSDGTWYARLFWNIQWGTAGDTPTVGDVNGDGLLDIAVWRPSDGNWHWRLFSTVQWGLRGDVPVT